MSIFSQKERTFTIHRNSSFASDLKSSISRKLLQFLGTFTDDVLAEYITVLVCNGKHQYQARDDLEAFLGERSVEFVSWLWDLLLKSAHPSGREGHLSDAKRAYVASSHISGAANKDSISNRSNDLSIHGTKHTHGSLRKDEKLYHHSTSASDHAFPINMVQHNQGLTTPLNKTNTDELGPQTCNNQIPGRVCATEKSNDVLKYEPPEMRGSTMVLPCSEQSIHYLEKLPKIGNIRCSGLYHQPSSCIRNEDTVNMISPSSTSEYPCIKQGFAAEVSGSVLPISEGPVLSQIETSRGSVWDRLGKPSDSTPAKSKSTDASSFMNMMEGDKSLTHHTLKPSTPNGDLDMNTSGRVYWHVRDINPMEKIEHYHAKNTTSKPNAASNIGQKRHFGEVTSGPTSGSDAVVGEGNIDLGDKEMSRDVVEAKHPKAATTVSDSEVLDVKQRLSHIEMEMYKLRSKQSEMERKGKPTLLAQFGTSKHPKDDSEDDIESRTVTVTNVHFAATKEAILSHFVKCGTIVNVVILTDKATAQPKGVAYISFAHKESVERAVALSGTTIFSRTIRVFKKFKAGAVTSGEALKAPLLPRVNRITIPNRVYPCRSHLQWRREAVPAASSVVTGKKSVKDEKVASVTQELASSVASTSLTG